MEIDDIMRESHDTAVKHGWWDLPIVGGVPLDRNVGEMIALMHSELSEALEEYRSGEELGKIYYSGSGKPEGFTVELADVIIRICELAEAKNLPLIQALSEKLSYNKTRPYRHGGKMA